MTSPLSHKPATSMKPEASGFLFSKIRNPAKCSCRACSASMPTKVGNYKYENSRQENAVIAAPALTPCHCEERSDEAISRIGKLPRHPAGDRNDNNVFALRPAAVFVFTILYSLFSILSFTPSLSAAPLELDYMEYTTTAAAQAAYVSNSSVTATGGTITEVGGYRIHTFTSNGTFTVTAGSGNIEVLVVGGGGGGGCWVGGGGGAGGLIYSNSFAVTSGAYSVVVGVGGTGSLNPGGYTGMPNGSKGGNSSFSGLTVALGGGIGASHDNTIVNGVHGGSGGGNGGPTYSVQGLGTSGQGNNGGIGYNTNPWACGGGGGAGAAGSNYVNADTAGNGGAGVYYTQFTHAGSPSGWFAGGGGGGKHDAGGSAGSGGNGGGGSGLVASTAKAGNGVANTGGGGGGNGNGGASRSEGGDGASGIVIVRYAPFIAYSEPTIKTQGAYAIKSSAPVTTSLNRTLTRTVSPTINLSDRTQIKFDIRSTRTGSNIKIGIRDSGGTTTYITPNITSANNYQTVDWDISGVSNANKDVIDRIIIEIVNADASNTFYIDNLFARWYPDAPTINRVTALSPTSIEWGWTDNSSGVDQEDGFRVYSSTAGLLSTRTTDTTFWIETGLKHNKEYSRYIQSYNTAGSSNSATITWRTKPGTFQAQLSQSKPARTGANSNGFVGDGVFEHELPVKSGQPATVTAWLRYNAQYGSASTKPKLTLVGPGINTSISATVAAEGSWEQRQLSGTPTRDGSLILRVEGFSTNPGAEIYVDDVSVSQ